MHRHISIPENWWITYRHIPSGNRALCCCFSVAKLNIREEITFVLTNFVCHNDAYTIFCFVSSFCFCFFFGGGCLFFFSFVFFFVVVIYFFLFFKSWILLVDIECCSWQHFYQLYDADNCPYLSWWTQDVSTPLPTEFLQESFVVYLIQVCKLSSFCCPCLRIYRICLFSYFV